MEIEKHGEGGCSGACGGDAESASKARLAERLSRIDQTLVVLSGKGGVGKSTVAVNLALALALENKRVGLLDIDLHGPSVPRMLGLEGRVPQADATGLEPIPFSSHLSVISIGFLLKSERDAVIWRGPRKFGAIEQLLRDVNWGALDYLVIDAPPGTGDEPLAICELTERQTGRRGAVVVTTSQGVALTDVRKCVSFCRTVGMPIHGMVENMSYLRCPHCDREVELYGSGGGEQLATESDIAFLGRIPFEPAIVASGEAGRPLVLQADQEGGIFRSIARGLIERTAVATAGPASDLRRYAIPIELDAAGAERSSAHFGHAERFALIDADPTSGEIVAREVRQPPPHEPGVLPRWIRAQGAGFVLAGGMGQRARELLEEQGVGVVAGVGVGTPEDLVRAHLVGQLAEGENTCDH